jgi:hypothetical protein
VPTAYPELNATLAELVAGATSILGENFCGAYLQGSFAIGDADEHSDVDFLIVTHNAVRADRTREPSGDASASVCARQSVGSASRGLICPEGAPAAC